MLKETITLQNKLGIHVRPASLIVKIAAKFKSNFYIKKDDVKINGKSIMGVMMLAAGKDSSLELIFDGVDEEALKKEIISLFNNKFGEE
ncbi:MAG: HPr family phosphocarrier protein [Candidatus Cloacimonadota bacterium]|nr:HPr family phosphocarrier protein [Candidatus Cloacimonadota bacterium]